MDSLNNVDNIDSIMGYDDSYEFQDIEKFSNDNNLKKIKLLDCPDEDIIWSTKTLGAQSSGNELFFDREESLKLDESENIFLYTKDFKKKSKIKKIVHMNSPNNNCPSTRITTYEDQDFSGQMGDIFYVGIRKEEEDAYAAADKLINKTDDGSSQKKDLNCPSCPKASTCPPVTVCPSPSPTPTPKPDIQCNSIYYFIIGFILSLIISGLVYYFVLYKEE